MAAGRPVIAYGVGGVTETVIPGKTGIFFNEQTWESILDAVINFDHELWYPDYIRNWALKFDEKNFKERTKKHIEDKYDEFKQGLEQCKLDVR